VYSHSGDDFAACKDYVRRRLGIPDDNWRQQLKTKPPPLRIILPKPADDPDTRVADAIALWRSSTNPRGTLAERYLNSRFLELDDDVSGEVLRWNGRTGAVVGLFRNSATNRPQAVSRVYLDRDGKKVERKFLGPVGGAAIKLDADENVLTGLHIGEGIETCMTARQRGLRPTWALRSCGAIAAFPILAGIECLTLLAENDEASERAIETCATRWHAGGREVFINRPIGGKDLNDALRGRP
jgi:hypothetical protein